MLAGVNIGLMEPSGSAGGRKRPYHHGDLRNALISAAGELAAQGGPNSVSIRAAARLVGVTPTAAYRHFAGQEELLGAAKDSALAELTDAMTKELAARPQSDDPVRYALGSLAALGRGYIAFARAQPGLFRTVFSWLGPMASDSDTRANSNPFQLLLASLDELVSVGYLSQERRPMAEFAAWSMVHGLAVLFDGPMREMPPEMWDEAIVRSMLILAHGMAGNGLTPAQEVLLADEMRRTTR
jgi:AcrR family transcriptional regulator